MSQMKTMNVKFFLSLMIAMFLVGCQTTKNVDTGKDDTTSVVVPADNDGDTTGIGAYDPTEGSEVNASTNGIVKDAYGNVIGEMIDGVFVPCTDCPAAGATAGQEDPLSITTIYFDYDQTTIKPEFRSVLEAHAQNISRSGLQLRLEGHADERGSREYNIGLGERRAQAVKRAMMLSGTNSSSLTTVSYGEEQPAVDGTNAESYALNRRVVLVYR